MRVTRSLLPTLREDPADAEAISHKLMLRAGLVRQLAAGVFVWLPLGQRVLDKVNAIIREEMNAIGGQEITMPVIHPGEIWKQSGRWDGSRPVRSAPTATSRRSGTRSRPRSATSRAHARASCARASS